MSSIENEQDEKSLHKHLIFRAGTELYAAPLKDILEVVEPCEITPSPNSPKEFLGMINLRGEIISVIDFRVVLNQQQSKSPKMLMVIVPSSHGKIATLVGELVEVHDFNPVDLDSNPTIRTSIPKDALTGVGKYRDKVVFLMVLPKILGASLEAKEAA